MMQCVLTHPDLRGMKRWCLLTRDAHGLYQRYGGFTPLQAPERWLERFFEFALGEGQTRYLPTGYVPLPPKVLSSAKAAAAASGARPRFVWSTMPVALITGRSECSASPSVAARMSRSKVSTESEWISPLAIRPRNP